MLEDYERHFRTFDQRVNLAVSDASAAAGREARARAEKTS